MHIAIVHGYFLKGTGSNLYVQNICRQLCISGHRVSLFCQEKSIEEYDFIAGRYDYSFADGEFRLLAEKKVSYPGECRLYRPDILGLLPVYVYDKYDNYRVKEYPDLSLEEIDRYIDCNQAALTSFLQNNQPDLFISNHSIMQPVYTSRALENIVCPHFVVTHGSDLEFSLRNDARLRHYALEGFAGADRIVFLSRHSQKEYLDFFKEAAELQVKSRIIFGGVDVEKFRPVERPEDKEAGLRRAIEKIRIIASEAEAEFPSAREEISLLLAERSNFADLVSGLKNLENKEGKLLPDELVASRLEAVDPDIPIVVFYGKYLWTKGIHLLITGIPLILQENPKTIFLLVGFGQFRVYLEALIQILSQGDRQRFFQLLEYLRKQEVANPFFSHRYWGSLLEEMKSKDFAEKYWLAAGSVGDRAILTGFMNHEILKELLPCCDVAVAPSIFPESFGLVAVEALASGLIPVQTNHSAFHEVIASYAKAFEADIYPRELKVLGIDEQIVVNLAENINHLLDFYRGMSWQDRSRIRKKAQAISLKKYSWQGVLAAIIKEYQTVIREN